MAARSGPRFYVYALTDDIDVIRYVGKGSGRRFQQQKSKFKLKGTILRRFSSEAKAYAYEIEMIEMYMPELNTRRGGNGGVATPIKPLKPFRYDWQREIDRIGTREYARRILISKGLWDGGTISQNPT